MPNTSQSWVVILPCHNKAEWIGSCVHTVAQTFTDEEDCEIVVVENGSTDTSAQVVAALPTTVGRIRISRIYSPVAGLGAAFQMALASRPDFHGWFILGSADLPFGTSDLQTYRNQARQCSRRKIFAASKLHPQSIVPRAFYRTFMTRVFEIVRRSLFPSRIRDTQATQCYPAEVLRTHLPLVQSHHFFFRTELLLRCERAGVPIEQIPVRLRLPESPSSVRVIADSWKMLSELVRFRLALR